MTDKTYTLKQEQLATYAKALAHPARIAIIQFLLRRKECYFGHIEEELPIAKATVSQHLNALKEAGLIQGTVEGAKVKYCINQQNWLLLHMLLQEFINQPLNKTNTSVDDCCCH
jgi:predicted transcriptional regulator